MLITEYMDEGDLWAALARPDSENTWHRRYAQTYNMPLDMQQAVITL